MAKSESTAVNELISLVQNGGHIDEPAQDLFAAPKPSRAPSPQPLERAPTGTSQLHLNNGKPVRMVTAPPMRAQSIPPLPNQRQRGEQARASTPPPPRPSPRASGQHAVVPPSVTVPPVAAKAPASTLPPPAHLRTPAPVAAPAPAKNPTPSNAIPVARTTPPKSSPIAAPFEHRVYGAPAYERAAIDKTGDSVSADNWFEASRAVDKIEETYVGTAPALKRRDPSVAIKRVLLPLVVLSVVSAGVAYVVFAHHGKKVAPPVTHVAAPLQPSKPQVAEIAPEAPAPAAAPAQEAAAPPRANANEQKIVGTGNTPPAVAPVAAPAPQQVAVEAPVVHEVQSAHGIVKLVDVRIDSKPAGATVMLVDNGKTQFLGTTPVAASVDPSRSYDVVLTLEGRPTQITHLDPTKSQKLEITLAKSGAAKAETPKAMPVKASAPARVSHAKKTSAPAGGIVDPGFESPKTDDVTEAPKAAAPKAKTSEGGEGTLMVSSKPPCEIWIDGKDTGLTTPQRAMSLPAGSHHVTFVNSEQNITKTVSVMISGGEATKLIQNLLN